jgi:putative ATP-dependent endonuclease of the OLD family
MATSRWITLPFFQDFRRFDSIGKREAGTKAATTLIEAMALKEAEERIPIELGIRLSSLFMYDRLVFVEGPSDELIIRELCNTLSVNLSRGSVGFVTLRGIGNLSYYAAKDTLEFLQLRNVRLTFLIDRDERAEAELHGIRERLGERVVFFATEPRELENYLIVPSALARYIADRKGNGIKIDAADIQSLVNSKTEELKGYTFLKHLCHRLRPIYPDREMPDRLPDITECGQYIQKIAAAMRKVAEDAETNLNVVQQRVTEQLQARWNSEKHKLVAGTELLDEVFKSYGLRFVKLRDGPGLAAMLTVSDIDTELTRILQGLDPA